MVLTSKFGCGRSGLAVQYAASTDLAWPCGNTVVFLNVHTQQQRLLVGDGQGIQSFCCNAKAGLVAVADQGYQPEIGIYRQSDLKQLQSIQADAEFSYTAIALSCDGELLAVCSGAPDMQLSVWHWRKRTKLVTADLQHTISSIGFHPADSACLLTVADPTDSSRLHSETSSPKDKCTMEGVVQLWRLDRLWSRHELQAVQLQLPAGCIASCQAWAPEGLYLGCKNGTVLCLDPESSAVLGLASVPTDGSTASAGISSVAVNKDAVVVASNSLPQLMFYSRATPALLDKQQQPAPSLQLIGGVAVSPQGCETVYFGGPLHKDLVATTTDGALLLLTCSHNSNSPADMQVEPLADHHTGSVTGLAAAPDGAHIMSCGTDGSVRAWTAATGQLVGKRDLGGRLTCCATALGNTAAGAASKPVMAVGSEAGVLRLLALTEVQRLPVIHRSRLHKSAITQVAFNPGGTCLAVAAAADQRVALLSLRGCEHVDVLGYLTAPDVINSLCWFSASATSQALLLLSLARGGLVAVTPPQSSSSSEQHAAEDPNMAMELNQSCAATAAAEVPLLQLAAVPPGKQAPSISSSGCTSQQQQIGTQILGLGSDGQLHRLLLPADAAGWTGLRGKVIHSIAKLQLSAPGTALAVSPCGHSMLLAGQDGHLMTLPAQSAAATAAALAAIRNSKTCNMKSNTGAADNNAAGSVAAHGSSEQGAAASVLAWSATGQWAATAARDGSVLLHAVPGAEHLTELPRTLPLDSSSIEDQEAPDDAAMATVPEAAAASAAAEAYTAGGAARQATLQKLQSLQGRLAQVMEANAAAPADQRLSDAELILDVKQLEQLRASVDTEVAALKTDTSTETQVTEIRAQRLKALCWDSMQTKGAVCTGLKSGSVEVWNFPLPAHDEARWAKVANLRRTEIIAAAAHNVASGDQAQGGESKPLAEAELDVAAVAEQGQTGPPSSTAAAAAAGPPGTTGANTDDADAEGLTGIPSSAGTISMSSTVDGSLTSARVSAVDSMVNSIPADQQLLLKLGSCAAASCKAEDLLYPELDVTYPGRKLTQAELYRRMVWDIKSQFNEEFKQLVKQKHCDADRLADLASRTDDLIRELVKIHVVLYPAAPAAQASAMSTAETSDVSVGGSAAAVSGPSVAQPSTGAAGPGDVLSGEQLAAELAVGRLTAHWSPLEELEDMLLHVKPGEVKAPRYLSPAEHAKAASDEAAAAEADRRVAADDSADRALKQMMGGRLERATDEVADLVASRPAWMNGDPASFSEEQLREYKEYCAKEQAAIEERLKRKAVMETELRTLRASAEDIAARFDEAVAALAAKRLDLQMEVAALECRVLRLMADYEVAAVSAGREAEQQAVNRLQAVQEQLTAVEKELAETHELHSQQQDALASLQADARAHDRALKAEFAEVDSATLPKLVSLYKNRIATMAGAAPTAGGNQLPGGTAGSCAGPVDGASAELEFQPFYDNYGKTISVIGSAAGGGAAAAAAAAFSSSGTAASLDLRGPLGPAPVQITALSQAHMPDGVDVAMWEKFIEFRAARGEMDVALRGQSAKLAWLQRQQELLLARHVQLSRQVEAAAEELEVLRSKRAAAIFDVELQLRLKQGQVEYHPAGVSASAPDALLVSRDQVAALNSSILAKGNAKLDLLRQMKEFKRGIYQLEWENRKCAMEAEDVISLTQQLQLLHVTKEFQQLVKGSNANAATAAKTTGFGGGSSGQGANKEVQSLENLLQVRETLHQKALAEKRRQLRRIEGLIAAKQQENASVSLQLSGLEKLLDDRSRLESAVAAGDPGSDRVMRTLMMQRKLQDIAAAQAAEIAAAEAELQRLQQRSFPCFPGGSATGSSGACINPAVLPTVCSSPHAGHAPLNSSRTQPASAARYGGGVVAAPGGAFAPAGSRSLRPLAPGMKVFGPDAKLPGSPGLAQGAAQPGMLVAAPGGRNS